MKVNILAENLKKGLSIAMRGVSSKAQLPILSNILIKAEKAAIVLSATDLELSFRVTVRGKVTEEGEIAIPAKLLMDLTATLPAGTIEMTLTKQTLSIVGFNSAGKEVTKTEILGQGAEEFPALPVSKGKGVTIDVEELREKIDRVGIAAARDDTRPILTGVLWLLEEKQLTLAATDGYRLGVDILKKITSEGLQPLEKFVLPVRALMELSKVLEPGMEKVNVEFDKEKQQVIFLTDDVEMSSRLIAGEFPPYQQVLPTTKKITVTLAQDDLSEAVKRASLFARDSANVVKLEIGENELAVIAQSDQMGSSRSTMEAEVEGENLTVALNAKYLLDCLGVLKTDKVVMETDGALKPMVFRLPETDFVHVIMPVRTQG